MHFNHLTQQPTLVSCNTQKLLISNQKRNLLLHQTIQSPLIISILSLYLLLLCRLELHSFQICSRIKIGLNLKMKAIITLKTANSLSLHHSMESNSTSQSHSTEITMASNKISNKVTTIIIIMVKETSTIQTISMGQTTLMVRIISTIKGIIWTITEEAITNSMTTIDTSITEVTITIMEVITTMILSLITDIKGETLCQISHKVAIWTKTSTISRITTSNHTKWINMILLVKMAKIQAFNKTTKANIKAN